MLLRTLRIPTLRATSSLRSLYAPRSARFYSSENEGGTKIQPELDEFIDAVERGDRETAKEMIKDAGIEYDHVYNPAESVSDTEVPKMTTRAQHIRKLAQFYSPKMIKSIIASEQSVTPDLWKSRREPISGFAISYVDDLAARDRFWDSARGEWHDPAVEPRQPVPLFGEGAEKAAEKKERQEQIEAQADQILEEHGPEAAEEFYNEEMQELDEEISDEPEVTIPGNTLSNEYLSSLTAKTLVRKVVSNVTRLGKIRSFYALVAVGDKNGMVGIGEGRHRENASVANTKARVQAMANMVYVPRYENRTIYGQLQHKYHGVEMDLFPRRRGFGVRTNHLVYEIANLAGIKDLAGKVRGSRNRMNTVKCTLEALTSQTLPEDIAVMRGKKVADIRKIYFEGATNDDE
ncbi:mitochondrial 37S ribosomal protein MRPS5 [Myxozyma melibiosi]|uniref:Mitochondrial 37S ribosomal protein MRPS5 n=1 Tax=Myxozyma melibiosi TaxID=54550 RepID=A0ABR1F3N3_9ASCO